MNLDTVEAAGAVTDPAPETLAAGRARLVRAVADAAAVPTANTARHPRRWALVGLAGAAAAALVAVPMLAAGSASAEGALLAAAEAAGKQADTSRGAQYWYVKAEVDYLETDPYPREDWHARTGMSVIRDAYDAAAAAFAAGHAELDPALIRDEGSFSDEHDGRMLVPVGDHYLTWDDIESLPTDPAELAVELHALSRGLSSSAERDALWESVTALLRGPASPELRRALWQVAASIPDVTLLGPTVDAFGRQGTGVERDRLDHGWFRVVYVLDPVDGTVLEWRNVDSDGVVEHRWTLVAQGPTAAAPEAELPVCGPFSESKRLC